MRKTTLALIEAEGLDLLTTATGLKMGFLELNPLADLSVIVLMKIVVTIGVSIFLEFKKLKLDFLIPIVAMIPVLWNGLNILAEIIVWIIHL